MDSLLFMQLVLCIFDSLIRILIVIKNDFFVGSCRRRVGIFRFYFVFVRYCIFERGKTRTCRVVAGVGRGVQVFLEFFQVGWGVFYFLGVVLGFFGELRFGGLFRKVYEFLLFLGLGQGWDRGYEERRLVRQKFRRVGFR